jgi:hypothetical protein
VDRAVFHSICSLTPVSVIHIISFTGEQDLTFQKFRSPFCLLFEKKSSVTTSMYCGNISSMMPYTIQ